MCAKKTSLQKEAADESSSSVIRKGGSLATKKRKISPASTTSVSFLITGFGPFGGVDDNPTSVIIQTLKDTLNNDEDTTSSNTNKKTEGALSNQQKWKNLANHIVHSLDVVNVSATDAKAQTQQIFSKIRHIDRNNNSSNGRHERAESPKTTDDNLEINQTLKGRQKIIILHFGVSPKRQPVPMFKLEQHAYNEANFRIPDQNGFQPSKQPIESSLPLSHRYTTDLNMKQLKDLLVAKGFKVSLSNDAGRFVCNYIYYQSLSHVVKFQEEQHIQMTKRIRSAEKNKNSSIDCSQSPLSKEIKDVEVHVLFVHVPSFDDIPQDTQIDFTMELLKSIEEIVSRKDDEIKKTK